MSPETSKIVQLPIPQSYNGSVYQILFVYIINILSSFGKDSHWITYTAKKLNKPVYSILGVFSRLLNIGIFQTSKYWDWNSPLNP